MADIQLVETSLRDGNQSLWGATGIDTAMTLTIAPVMDRVGFKAIDFTTSTHMGVAVRYKREDPWERIRLMAAATPNTPLQFMSTGFRFISWDTASPEFMALAFRTLARNGIRRFCLADPMNDVDAQIACARMVKQAGGEYVIAALVYTLSPIHDDAHYVEAARRLAACADVDALYIKDPGGLLLPQRAQHADSRHQGGDRRQGAGAAFALHDRARGARLHGCAGLRRQRAAMRLGRRGGWHLESAFGARGREPARAGPSRGYRRRGAGRSGPLSSRSWPRRKDCRAGRPQAFDAAYLRHQLPGGVVSTMRRHLGEARLSHMEGAVIAELGRVREELGWPIVMTPFAQMILTLAVMNVTGKERYAVIPDEVIRYALGRFGTPEHSHRCRR